MTVDKGAGAKKYWAFISYSSLDRSIGERFHRELERFVIPRALRGRSNEAGIVPKRLIPIFRDRWDLDQTPDLGERIEAALKESRALIVFCSPRAAASKWVNKEIATYKHNGGANRIIAAIIDGEPNEYHPEKNPKGAFPHALTRCVSSSGEISDELEKGEIYAPDLRDAWDDGGGDGVHYSRMKVIARVAALPLTELLNRNAEAEKRDRIVQRAITAVAVFLISLAIFGGGIAYHERNVAERQTELAQRNFDATLSVVEGITDQFIIQTMHSRGYPGEEDMNFLNTISDRLGGIDPQMKNADVQALRLRVLIGLATQGQYLNLVEGPEMMIACRKITLAILRENPARLRDTPVVSCYRGIGQTMRVANMGILEDRYASICDINCADILNEVHQIAQAVGTADPHIESQLYDFLDQVKSIQDPNGDLFACESYGLGATDLQLAPIRAVLNQRKDCVRRQGFWDRWQPDLREDLAHLIGFIMRRICGESSAGFRWSSV